MAIGIVSGVLGAFITVVGWSFLIDGLDYGNSFGANDCFYVVAGLQLGLAIPCYLIKSAFAKPHPRHSRLDIVQYVGLIFLGVLGTLMGSYLLVDGVYFGRSFSIKDAQTILGGAFLIGVSWYLMVIVVPRVNRSP